MIAVIVTIFAAITMMYRANTLLPLRRLYGQLFLDGCNE